MSYRREKRGESWRENQAESQRVWEYVRSSLPTGRELYFPYQEVSCGA